MSERVNGPYKHRGRWRVHIIISHGGTSTTEYQSFASKDEAEEFKRAVEREIASSQDAGALRAKADELRRLADQYSAQADHRDGRGMTVGMALEQYLEYMRQVKGNAAKSVETTSYRVRGLMKDLDASLSSVSERRAAELYESRCTECAPDTHRNELGAVKTFMGWCVGKGWIRRNPFDKVKGVGKRRQGKEQLRIVETRDVVAHALALARQDDAQLRTYHERQRKLSALAVLVAVFQGMRASEIVNIRKRDIDDGGRILWIPDSKSDNGRRALEVPAQLGELLRRRAEVCGTDPMTRLFPHPTGWIRDNVKRLCREAGVPEVTAHGARGIHATISAAMGATSHLVAAALGQDRGGVVAERHYIRPGTLEAARRDRFQRLISLESEGRVVGAKKNRCPDEKKSAPSETPNPAPSRPTSEPLEWEMETPETVSHEERPPEVAPLGWPKMLKPDGFLECEGGDSNPHSVNH